jgi:hypothetical protein
MTPILMATRIETPANRGRTPHVEEQICRAPLARLVSGLPGSVNLEIP